jgi:hypothetical protein
VPSADQLQQRRPFAGVEDTLAQLAGQADHGEIRQPVIRRPAQRNRVVKGEGPRQQQGAAVGAPALRGQGQAFQLDQAEVEGLQVEARPLAQVGEGLPAAAPEGGVNRW